ncbi:Pre-mRNA 3'-end-processing factor FIP1 [Gossypium arboreum]|uniref:Pre-mRNA 3'-end-processing factor FIP1 n=1 Tax=Gossypium arboreum TaxID=29729 RepID=A0A0B0NHF3_GOSAR|nr:Pre-mRNA 3'-end-processing factor FIP1 [Gossypium arboreum]
MAKKISVTKKALIPGLIKSSRMSKGFFNFGLNEESWKDYCKQLGYDPDLPPELAAATGQETSADTANLGSRKRELVERTMNSIQTNVPEDDGILPFCGEISRPYGPGFRSQSPMYHNGNFGSPRDERHRQGRARERSPHMTPSRGKRDKLSDTHSHEESVESMDHKSPLLVKDDVDDELEPTDRSPVTEKDFELEPADRSPVT